MTERLELVRYGNRKIYFAKERRYTTLREISQLLSLGYSVRVVCHKTKMDITERTLLSVAFYSAARNAVAVAPIASVA